MIVSHKISVDLVKPTYNEAIHAVQDDRYCRGLEISIFSDGEPWCIPMGTNVQIRFSKSDGTGGAYDTMPDGSAAWVAEESILCVRLAPQIFTAPGPVSLAVVMTLQEQQVSTFALLLQVHPAVTCCFLESEDYVKIRAEIPAPLEAEPGMYLKIGSLDGNGRILTTEMGDLDRQLAELTQMLAGKGDRLYKDEETGLLYLRSGEENLGQGIPLGGTCAGGELNFDSGYLDEEGYLHLTSDGQEAKGFTPFFVGTGGGTGDGDGFGSDLRLVSTLESRIFSIMDTDEECILSYNWSSVDSTDGSTTGGGTASWSINGTRVAVQKVSQGDNSFDVRKYLTDGQENTVVLTVSDAYGNSKPLSFTINITAFSMSWNLQQMTYHQNNALTLRMVPTGTGDKTLTVRIDGETAYTETVSTSGRTVSVPIEPMTHGAHVIEAWLEVEVLGETMRTEPLRHVGIWTEEGNTDKVVAVLEPQMQVKQYATASVKFMVVDPQKETSSVALEVGQSTIATLENVGRTMQVWSYKAAEVGSLMLQVVCGEVSDQVELSVEPLEYAVSPVMTGLVMDIDPTGHSNTETGRESFGYVDGDGVNHPFTFSQGFDWTRGGFRTDEEGAAAFVIPRGSRVTADRSLFDDNAKGNGKELKLVFKAVNVRNYDAELMRCLSGGVGILIQAQQATVSSEAESMSVPYCEGKKIEMDLNIEAESENSLAYVCMKAIPSAKPIQYGKTDSWTQTVPENFTIGSDECDVWLYRMKLYGNSLNRFEILDNYIADCANPEEMAQRFLRNDIFNDDGTISLGKLTRNNPGLRTITLRADRMTTGKDDEVSADVEMIYEAGGEGHHLIAENAVFKAQGTSSLEYILAALNLDIDFSEADSWVDGKGEPVTAYSFTENSIPVDYFNCKADVASSESANNVVLTDDYNTYNPVPFSGKKDGVRDCIEGHPCAVFFTNTSSNAVSAGARSVAPGETILYFAGNMNNSKKNFDVFGWDSEKWPEQCCVEVLNNIALQCRFLSDDLSTETWDGKEGTSNFEFAYPKNPTDEMKQKFSRLLSWVVSTNVEAATDENLAEPAVISGITYVKDSAAYRQAKFLAEFDDYFVRDQMLFHFLFTERHCMADNRAKNLFLCYDYYDEVQGYRWSVRRNYDNDTAEGCDNSGGATFTYGLELDDIVGDSYVFNANDSVLWQNIRNFMHSDLLRVYKSNKDAWNAQRIIKKFNDYQDITPEALRVEDMWNKYFAPLLLAGESAFLKRCHGKKEYWREQFEVYQGIYMDSEYCDTSDRSNCISLRATVSSAEAGNIQITPYSDLYVNVMYGTNGTVRIRGDRNETVTVECPTDSLTDTEVYIFSASRLKELGSLAKLKTKFVTLTKAEKLLTLSAGSGEAGYKNLNMTELGLGSNNLLEYLDIQGLPNLKGAMNLSELSSLEEFYSSGSGITSLTFAVGAPLRKARINAVGSLTARELNELELFSMDGSNLQSIWVENSPAIDTLALCRQAETLIRGRLTDVSWTDANADVVTRLAALRQGGGMDAMGNTIDGFVLTGSFYCDVITQDEINVITEAFPDLRLDYGQIVPAYTVTFRNDDGTVYEEGTQRVRQGAAAKNPITAGLIPVPVKPSTVEEVYSFTGWDAALTNITADRVITAQYLTSDRYYTVNWWYDTSRTMLLRSDQIIAHGSALWNGGELTGEDGTLWAGWDTIGADVTCDLDIHAVFVVPQLPDSVPGEYDYLYSNDSADKRAFTESEFFGILYYGREKEYFHLGDRIRLVCATDKFTDESIMLELRSWKHFESAENAGAFAGPYFGMVGLMNQRMPMKNEGGNEGGYPATNMPGYLDGTVLPGLPQFIKALMEKIRVHSSAGGTSGTIVSVECMLTLESYGELGRNNDAVPYINEVAVGADEVVFSCYADNASRIKKTFNGEGTADSYWSRSPIAVDVNRFHGIQNNGASSDNSMGVVSGYGTNDPRGAGGVSFGFCLKHNQGVQ